MGEPARQAEATPSSRWRRRAPVVLALVAGMALSLMAFGTVRRWEERRLGIRFSRLAGDRVAAVQRGAALNIEQLRSIRSFFAASQLVERHEFEAFVRGALEQHKAIQALQWAPRVPAAERDAFEAQARRDGLAGYQIAERDAEGKVRRAGEREFYYPISYLMPREGNEAALGLDVGSDPAFRKAIEETHRTGKAVATGAFELGGETGGVLVCQVFLPVYRNDPTPGVRTEAPADLLGFAVGVFRLGALVDEALGHVKLESIEMRLYDGLDAPDWRLLVYRGPSGDSAPPEGYLLDARRARWGSHPRRFHVAGRTWSVVCTPTAEFFATRQTWQAWGVLVLGPLFTALATLYVASYVGRTIRVERLVAERTAALSRANERLGREMAVREQAEADLEHERNLLRALIDNMPDYIFVKDAQSRFVVNNKAHIRVLGAADADAVVGETDFEFFPRELAERYFADEQAILASGKPVIAREEPTVDPSGQTRWVSTTKVPLHDSSGAVVGIVGISRDITDHRRAEEALEWEAGVNEALAGLARALLAVGPIEDISAVVLDHARRLTDSELGYVGYIDPDTGYLICPTLTREIWDACEVEGKDIAFKEFAGLWGWVLTERKPLLSNKPDSDPRWKGIPPGHMAIRRFLSAPAAIGAMLVGQVAVANASRDYTERDLRAMERLADLYAIAVWRKRAEEEIERAAAELARSNRELEQFAYVASHDLQEPLRMVGSFVQLLAQRYEGQLDGDADEFIHFAVDGATRMRQLIEDLLAFSRVGTRAQPLEPTSCEDVLAEALANLRTRIEESGAEVTHDPLPTVLADERQLVQVFQNLLSNAIKFRSAEPPRIHVSADESNGEWEFAVRDNGIGVDPRHADRIFEIFKRLHTRDEYPGTGIGLAICRKTVERHGGRIWVDSQPGQGSTFRFTLPGTGETPR